MNFLELQDSAWKTGNSRSDIDKITDCFHYFETVLRYLFSTMDDISAEAIKEVAEQALSGKEGGLIMTLAERLRKEGEIRGEIKGKIEGKLEGKLEGLTDAIELGMTLKFPDNVNVVMAEVKKINDIDRLTKIKDAIKTAKQVSEILLLTERRG